MVALAEVLKARGAKVSGSDTDEKFYTDRILDELKIPFEEHFSKDNIADDVKLMIHSAAYSRTENPELIEADSRQIPILSYPEMLGELSQGVDASGITGTHGKSTTTAMVGTILKILDLPVTVVNGTEVFTFNNRSSLMQGEKYFVAEACEYRRHFLHFHPQRIAITSIEREHLDYFKSEEDIYCAFEAFGGRISHGGDIVFNADDAGTLAVVSRLRKKRSDLNFVSYGANAHSDYRIVDIREEVGQTLFQLSGFDDYLKLNVPGKHSVGNASAAIALSCLIYKKEYDSITADERMKIGNALTQFRGSRRRSEVVGKTAGVIICDDYGHHPTEIMKTIAGFRRFYPMRRLLVDFMPHLYSRTEAFLREFGTCFSQADVVLLHEIYGSARETDSERVTGRDLFHEVSRNHTHVYYFEEVFDALPFLVENLREGDLFLTIGAGDNWKLGHTVFERLQQLSIRSPRGGLV